MNLALVLGALGLAREIQGEQLSRRDVVRPVRRPRPEGILYGTYSGSRFVVVGTPSGISLSREGGAHQSTITPGVGIELPGTYAEPCYGREPEWLLLRPAPHAGTDGGGALRAPFDQARRPGAVLRARRAARRGGRPEGCPCRRVPPARAWGGTGHRGAGYLRSAGCPRRCRSGAAGGGGGSGSDGRRPSSSPDRLYRGWHASRLAHLRNAATRAAAPHLERLVLHRREALLLVTAIDGASHSLAFVGSCLGVRCTPLGVDRFGQVGSQPALYDAYDLARGDRDRGAHLARTYALTSAKLHQ